MDHTTITLTLALIDQRTIDARRRHAAHQAMAQEVAAMLARSAREIEALAVERQTIAAHL
jgi:hypothetical protein